MEIVIGALYFVFGTLIGSSLNVVILRYHNRSFLRGRSFCFMCGNTLSWYELIPIFSYLFQKGYCAKCRGKISPQYILVELGTGFLFLFVYLKGFVGIEIPIILSALSLLVAILVYDIHHKIIPDGLAYLFIILSFIQLFLVPQPLSFTLPSTSALLAGPLLFIPFFALWFFSRGTWMGLGDGKLALGMGWFLGLGLGLSAIVFSFWIGAIVSLFILYISKLRKSGTFLGSKLTLKSEIPFAPFLIAGFFIALFLEWNLANFIF